MDTYTPESLDLAKTLFLYFCSGRIRTYEKYKPLYVEFSPYNHVDAKDPPLFMTYKEDMTLPSKDAVRLDFTLARGARVGITLHDLRGRLVRRLMPATDLGAGSYTPSWDGRDDALRPVESGLYFARLTADGESHEWRIVIAR